MTTFLRRSRIEAPAEEVFRWHERPGAFERLTPPWEQVEVVSRTGGAEDGARVTLRVGVGPLRSRWVAEHRDTITGRQFRDVQVSGPFARWNHLHSMTPEGPEASTLEDRLDYLLPAGALGDLIAGRAVRAKLGRLFAYRHRITADDIAAHTRCRGGRAMKVLVTGSTGLLGGALVPFLTAGRHDVTCLVRGARSGASDVAWDPDAGRIDATALSGIDAVVHLAGEGIATGRWTEARKRRIRDSRVGGTELLARTLAGLASPPTVFVCASAIGYYGTRGDEVLTESSASGTGFLAEVCRGWEEACAPAAAKGIRVVNLRFGMILSPAGGALAKMLPPFRAGAGGRIGPGTQFMSWIAIDDAVGAVHHSLLHPELSGAVNAVAPEAVTNEAFTRTLGRVLSRPALAPVPALAARLAFGEMADALLLSSQRVAPERLRASGYVFRHPGLEGALRHVLGRTT